MKRWRVDDVMTKDAQIRADVVDQIVGPVLGTAGSTVQVTTANGVVTLRGRLKFRSTAAELVRLSRQVPGVVAVTDDLHYDIDDKLPPEVLSIVVSPRPRGP